MTIAQKVGSLKAKRANLLGRIKKEKVALEKQFALEFGRKPTMEQITSATGKYWQAVGPLLKEARELQRVIELLS